MIYGKFKLKVAMKFSNKLNICYPSSTGLLMLCSVSGMLWPAFHRDARGTELLSNRLSPLSLVPGFPFHRCLGAVCIVSLGVCIFACLCPPLSNWDISESPGSPRCPYTSIETLLQFLPHISIRSMVCSGRGKEEAVGQARNALGMGNSVW